jgi:hypothetical protein
VRTIREVLLVEGVELRFRYASVAIAIEVTEGRGPTRTAGSTGAFHAFGSGTEVTTGRRALAVASTFTTAFGATGRSITVGFGTEVTTGRRTLAVASTFTTTFGATGRSITVGFGTEVATGRRTLAVASAFGATGWAIAIGIGTEVTTGWRTLAVATAFTTAFGATGRSITIGFGTEVTTSLHIAPFTATLGAGELGATVAAAVIRTLGPLKTSTFILPGAGTGIRAGGLLGNDYTAQANHTQGTQAAGEEGGFTDTMRCKDSFVAHVDILLLVWRAVTDVQGFDFRGVRRVFGSAFRPSSCPTVAPEDNESRPGQITSL